MKSLALVAILATASISAFAQTNRTRSTPPASALLSSLPPSDGVAFIKMRRVLDEAMPKLLAENPAQLAELNNELAEFKNKTGIDPRSFEEMALSFQFSYPSPAVTKIRTVALARGTFNSGALVAAGRMAANGKYVEQEYRGKTIYIFTLDRQLRLFGLWNLKVRDLAVTSINGNVLALGDIEAVKAALDANRSRKHANPDLIAMASHDPNAMIGFGGNISESLMETLRVKHNGIAREMTAVRKVYGSLGMTNSDLELMVAARTVDSYSAKNLGDTVEGLKALAGLFIGRLPAAKESLARAALNNLKITTAGNDLQIRTAVAQAQVAPLIRGN
ncbi:MAG TPA: hypothetical protein VJV03_13540 [Pyrinomonadaceae bacterium]|nr:hypothetical protein [Pyrinomonadaceae bacterium]